MEESTLIEIVLAHFNGSRFIREQLASIFDSELSPDISIKVLIIDDCSSDEEFKKLQNLVFDIPKVTLFRNEKNLGVVKTFEKGLSLTRAPYVMLCDQDDVWMPHKVSSSIKKIKDISQNDAALVFTDLKIVDSNLNLIHPSMRERYGFNPDTILNSILLQNIVTGCTVIMNRRLVELSLPFPKNVVIHDHWIALCAAYGGKISFLPVQTINYRQHGGNLIGAPKHNILGILWNIRKFLKAYIKDVSNTLLQIHDLTIRLNERSFQAKGELISQIETSLKHPNLRNINFLKKNNVVRFNFKSICVILLNIFKTNSNNV